jgi:plastocyanin
MKKLLLILFIISSFNSKGAIHQIQVWNGYYQFLPPNNITVQLGDTIQWIPLDPPAMTHTITSNNIPAGAVAFNQIWQLPADTFFQYIPQVAGLYQYVCTPHIINGMIGEFTVVNGTTSQKTYVPDDNFENYLETNGMGDGIQLNDSINTLSIEMLMYLDVSNQNISDLTGIEDFTVLSTLNCSQNQLTSLDLSFSTALTDLNCGHNQLTNLDVSNNTALIDLYLNNNQITALDISNNTSLAELGCWDNQLTSLDLSNNIALYGINCSYNQLTYLNISSITLLHHFDCMSNQLTSLDVSNNTNTASFDLYCRLNPYLLCIDVYDVAWATANWTIANGYIDPQHYFSNNCSGTTNIQEQTTNKELLKVTDLLGRETKVTKNEILFYIYDDGTVEKKIIIE